MCGGDGTAMCGEPRVTAKCTCTEREFGRCSRPTVRPGRTVHDERDHGFWGLAKVRLTTFKGLPRHTFHLHLKETEWRYNHRHANKYTYLLQYLRKNPLS